VICSRPYSSALLEALGFEVVEQRAAKGDGEAQFSQGCLLVSRADGIEGLMGAGGRSPIADVGLALSTYVIPGSHRTEARRCSMRSLEDDKMCKLAGANPKRRRARRSWRRRQGKGTRTLC